MTSTETMDYIQCHVGDIAALVCNFYHIPQKELKGSSRRMSVAYPRQVFMYLARRHSRLTLEEIGMWVGFRDHTTVLHGVRSLERSMAERDKPEHARKAMELDYLVAQLEKQAAAA